MIIFLAGGVGFDINCGVRLIRTNLFEKDVSPIKEQLAQVIMMCVTVYILAYTCKNSAPQDFL